MERKYFMIQTNQVIQTGDPVKETENPIVQTDQILSELNVLYVERCKVMQEGNTIAVEWFNKQIANLKTKLAQI
jgi:hypothetical protein